MENQESVNSQSGRTVTMKTGSSGQRKGGEQGEALERDQLARRSS